MFAKSQLVALALVGVAASSAGAQTRIYYSPQRVPIAAMFQQPTSALPFSSLSTLSRPSLYSMTMSPRIADPLITRRRLCPMPVFPMDSARSVHMPTAVPDSAVHSFMPVATPPCDNPLRR